MTQFQVDSEQVLAANTAIQSTIGRVQSDISALHAQMQSLQDSWRGLAANQFQELALRWHTTATAVQAQLGELGQADGQHPAPEIDVGVAQRQRLG